MQYAPCWAIMQLNVLQVIHKWRGNNGEVPTALAVGSGAFWRCLSKVVTPLRSAPPGHGGQGGAQDVLASTGVGRGGAGGRAAMGPSATNTAPLPALA